MLRLLTLSLMALAAVLPGQRPSRVCENMAYENRNQTDYGPLRLSAVRGIAKDGQGVAVPSVCIGVFTETDHKLIAAMKTDENGQFEVKGIPRGEYRMVANYEGFCPANARIRVEQTSRSKKRLSLVIRPAGLDTCSYFELK